MGSRAIYHDGWMSSAFGPRDAGGAGGFHLGSTTGSPLDITLSVGGGEVGSAEVPISAPLLFSANECLDVGICLGSPVALDDEERAPFAFNGTIDKVHVRYLT